MGGFGGTCHTVRVQRVNGGPQASGHGATAVDVSIAVCTLNRAALLDRCLASIARAVPMVGAEVLVVDNGSTDTTASVAERWSGSLPLRAVTERRTGLSHARNRALSTARGDVVAFLDDDVLVGDGWLDGVRRAFGRSPGVGVVAGRVALSWPGGRPSWLPSSREVWFARLDLGDEARTLAADEYPVGANMAVRRSVADVAGRFDPGLGYSGARLLGNEEIDFVDRVRAAGHGVGYEPSMVVDHVVEGDRVSRTYLLRRIYSQGRSDVRMLGGGEPTADPMRQAADALGRATVRGWRSDLRRLRRPGGLERNLIDVSAGRAKQLGRAREWAAVAVAVRADGRSASRPAPGSGSVQP